MLNFVDMLTDGVTMYRLLLYYLGGLLAVATGLSAGHVLHYNALYILVSTVLLLAVCWLTNKVFAYIFNAPSTSDSSLITALILALIITPNLARYNLLFFVAAGGLAMASKYLITIRKKHIFNPAAVAIALTAIGPRQTASWWIGTAVMVPFVVLGGMLIVRKIRRERMVATFFLAAVISTCVYSILDGMNIGASLHSLIFSSPFFFLGFVMLTEPLTSPPTATKRAWYATLVGVLLPPQVHVLNFYASPELALLAGNIYSYIMSPKTKLFPAFKQKVKITPNAMDFVFEPRLEPKQKFVYQPGQYMEWTLPHAHADARGNRRYLTITSSPTEPDIQVGVKFHANGSSFKQALLNINEQTPIVATQLAGDFVLPRDTSRKLVFIAGGIGITPFRSMAKYLTDRNEHRDVHLLYAVHSEADIAYGDIFEQAQDTIGLKTTYVVSDAHAAITRQNAVAGRLHAQLVAEVVPDFTERTFYISGSQHMVAAMQKMLLDLGVRRKNIKIDSFSGYA